MRKSEVNNEPIIMDEYSYNRYLEGIEKDREEIKKMNKSRSEAHKPGTDVQWDGSELMLIDNDSSRLERDVIDSVKFLNNVKIVYKKNLKDIVEVGDILRLKIVDQYGEEEMLVKLIGNAKHDESKGYLEISVNATVGSLIYGKKVGEKISYNLNGNVCYVEILEKIDLENEKVIGSNVSRSRKK